MIYLSKHQATADFNSKKDSFARPHVAIVVEDDECVYEPLVNGQIPKFAVIPNTQSYTGRTYSKVFDIENNKWYMLNNLNQYEEYGIYDTTGSSLSDYTYYEGKLVAIGTDEYQYSGNTWVNVGTYKNNSVVYTFDNTSPSPYRGQTITSTFKIPKSDIEAVGGSFSLTIQATSVRKFEITESTYKFNYDFKEWDSGTITDDGVYLNYSLNGYVDGVYVSSVSYNKILPIRLMIGDMEISVEYQDMEKPYGAVSFSSVTDASNYDNVYYGLQGNIGGHIYIYKAPNVWGLPSSQKNYLRLNALSEAQYGFTNEASSGKLYISYDLGDTWVDGSKILKVQSGTSVMIKGNLIPSIIKGIGTFSSTGNFTVEGNAMSLLFGDDFQGQTSLSGKSFAFRYLFSGCTRMTSAENLSLPATTLADYCYQYMFYNCTSLTAAPSLPATTLADYCYGYMFYGCRGLTTAPSLPATTLASSCYERMFQYCSGLTAAPSLLATTLANSCYTYMFSSCTSLTTAPSLPATTLTDSCYQYMFNDCTNLTTAPSLPATTLAPSCYDYMFQSCTSLTTAPSLPAETLASSCYSNMFFGCSSLTTAPQLPATTLAQGCYQSMFSNCTGLTTAPSSIGTSATTMAASACTGMFSSCTSLTTAPQLPSTTLANYCYCMMFYKCSSLTTAPQLSATTLAEGCYQQMFQDCTSLTTASQLPATTLAERCYKDMFSGCRGLTTAPSLLATTLANYCYQYMFNGCTSLSSITCLATDISASNCTQNWVSNISVNGTFTKAASMNSWTTGTSGIPNGWNVVDA